MSAKGKPWRTERFEGISVPIYRSMEAGAWRYRVVYRPTRHARRFTDPDAASAHARDLARSVSLDGTRGTGIVDRREAEALDVLRSLGDPLLLAHQLAEAWPTLRGRSLPDVARIVATHFPTLHGDDTVTVAAAVAKFLAHVEARDRNQRLYWRSQLGKLTAHFGERRLIDISRADIATWHASFPHLRGYGARNLLRDVTRFFNWCREQDMLPAGIQTAPSRIPLPPKPKAIPPIWHPSELRQMLAALPPELAVYLAIASFAGLRPTEISKNDRRPSLKWSDIDLAAGYIYVRPEVATKLRRPRYVPIVPCLAAWLTTLKPSPDFDGRVCRTSPQAAIRAHLRAEGLPFRWPQDICRHSYISYQVALTGNRPQVAEWAGNTETIIRSHYQAPVKKETAEAYFAIFPEGWGSSGNIVPLVG